MSAGQYLFGVSNGGNSISIKHIPSNATYDFKFMVFPFGSMGSSNFLKQENHPLNELLEPDILLNSSPVEEAPLLPLQLVWIPKSTNSLEGYVDAILECEEFLDSYENSCEALMQNPKTFLAFVGFLLQARLVDNPINLPKDQTVYFSDVAFFDYLNNIVEGIKTGDLADQRPEDVEIKFLELRDYKITFTLSDIPIQHYTPQMLIQHYIPQMLTTKQFLPHKINVTMVEPDINDESSFMGHFDSGNLWVSCRKNSDVWHMAVSWPSDHKSLLDRIDMPNIDMTNSGFIDFNACTREYIGDVNPKLGWAQKILEKIIDFAENYFGLRLGDSFKLVYSDDHYTVVPDLSREKAKKFFTGFNKEGLKAFLHFKTLGFNNEECMDLYDGLMALKEDATRYGSDPACIGQGDNFTTDTEVPSC